MPCGTIPTMASLPNSKDSSMKAESFAGFVPKCPQGLAFGRLFLIVYQAKIPADNQLLGTSFQKARRAFWGEARPGFGVHWCVYV